MLVRISGRNAAFRKDEVIRTTRTLLHFTSADAEHLTDIILEGDTVSLNLPAATADQYCRRIRRLGVIAELLAE